MRALVIHELIALTYLIWPKKAPATVAVSPEERRTLTE
jgi:hypothetical protein